MKKIVSVLMILLLCLGMAACGGESPDEPLDETTENAILDLTGDWVQTDSDSIPSRQIAKINDKNIELYWERDGEAEPELFWVGSYVAPDSATEQYSWTAERDAEETDKVLFPPKEKTIEFTYEDGIISYEFTASGETKSVTLERK